MLRSALTAAAAALLPVSGAVLAAGPAPLPDRAHAVLSRRCGACHMGGQQKGGLRLDSREDALRGGDSGPALRPERPAESLLLRLVLGAEPTKRMPPSGPALPPAEAALLRAWVEAGAPWPASAARSGNAAGHWAFRPVTRPALPRVPGARPSHPVDAFVRDRLARQGIRPSPPADRATLLRRVTLDLTGLPPTPEEVEGFLADRGPGAYEKVVDRLLASPHFGERWGRHWLDLARYADSDGYEKDLPRPYAYLYRDWVIQSLNRDMPFDQFTVEQLAGDLLPGATPAQRTATGFHRNTLKNREGGADPEEDRVKNTVDRINTTATVWLGLTVGCAQCHSHKYDPVSQREYFQLYAFFDRAREADLPAASGKEDARVMTLAEQPEARPTRIHVRGDFLRPGEVVEPAAPVVLPPLKPAGAVPTRLDLARWLVSPDNPLTPRVTVNRVWQQLFGRGLVGTPDDFGTRGERPTHPELLDWLAAAFTSPAAPAGGAPEAPGTKGSAVRGSPGTGDPRAAATRSSESPLLSPGMGWSLKGLIRLLVTSETYRQSSGDRPELKDRDPRNLLLARQTRFPPEAEIVRDLYLAASGLLNRTVGGPSIRPPLPADIAALGYAGSVKWPETTGPERYKRGMYVFFQRTVPYPMLTTFDAPDSNTACTRRERSNTPLQALTLLNDPVFFECAQAMGRRVVREAPTGTRERVRYLFRACLSREPSAREAGRLERLHAELLALAREDAAAAAKLAGQPLPEGADAADVAAWVGVARTVMNLDEFVTRE